jgi:hypothetical protein
MVEDPYQEGAQVVEEQQVLGLLRVINAECRHLMGKAFHPVLGA